MKSFSLNIISKYRQELMGFSAILILICHAVGNDVMMPGIVKTVLNFGNIGVDMFLFLSGMGMYYSFNSNRGGGVISWYIRRYKRILIPYLVIAIPFYAFKVLVKDSSVGEALYDLSTISYWTHHRSAWFIALLFPLYALIPLLAKLIDSFKSNRWLPSLLLCAACLAFSVFYVSSDNPVMVNVTNAVRRIPGFIVGYWMGKGVQETKEVSIIGYLGISISTFLLLFLLPLKVYCFWILMFPLIFVLIWLYKCEIKWFSTLCLYMGAITLELYLTNGYTATILRHVNWQVNGIDLNYGNFAFYGCVLVIGIVWSVVANKLSKKIMDIIIKR